MRLSKNKEIKKVFHQSRKGALAYVAIACIIIAIMVIILITFIAVMRYTFFYTDDYTHSGLQIQMNSSIRDTFPFALKRTAEMYETTGGSYSSIFFEFLLDPLCFNGFLTLHFWLGASFCYFFLSMILFLSIFFRRFKCGLAGLLLIGCICWAFINYKAWTETFFWFTGAMAYTMPLASLLYMFYFLFLVHEKKKIIFCLLSFLFGILAMGGVLCIAFVGCYGLILLLIVYIREKSLTRIEVVLFLGIIAFGLINALAPGNYARHSLYEGNSISVLQGFWYAIRATIIQLEKYIKDTGFSLVLAVVFLIGIHMKEGYKSSQLRKSLIYLTFPVVALFPAILGYGSPYMPNRVLFVSNFFLIFALVHLVWQVGRSVAMYINNKTGEKTLQITTLLTLFTLLCAIPYRIEDGEVYKLGKASTDDSLENYYQEMVSMDSYLRSARGEDVRVVLPEPIDGFLEFWLEDDPTSWVNREIAVYYGNSSVTKI